MSFPADQVSDLNREVRVAQVDGETGELREVISQVYDAARRGKRRTCHVVFQADVAANRAGHYLVLYGNPEAELPNYNTDLNVRGEGFGLDIENRHFIAHLSRQMGQMDRLTYKREHGLELFAGGKGHGEPPGIDWAHDYVDHGGFQKLRMRAWADCPNFEIVRGPLCVRVRRWGFPHSPIHPLFTPSRVHMDQAYVFYAGLPYFFKQGRIEMIQDVEISAMRDDEWVISGYSFTDQLWIDREGKVHEGDVPGSQSDDLWGVGYYHADSRDAFVALRLDHSAEGFAELAHGGVPMLHYAGHGLVWSRYPANQAELDAGDAILQTNAYTVFPYPEEGGAVQLEQLRRELLHPLRTEVGTAPTVAPAASEATLARPGETPADAPLKRKLWQALREVKDEQLYTIDANIVDLGYVYDLKVRNGTVNVLVTMPHRGRPVFNFLVFQGGGRVQEGIYERLMKVPTVRDVLVEFAWHPAWDASRLTPAGRKSLGLEDF